MRAAVTLGLVFLLATAGCAGVTAPTDTPAPDAVDARYRLSNEADQTRLFTVVVTAEPFGGLEVRYRNGSSRIYADVDNLEAIPPGALDGAVSFAPLSGDAVVRRYRLTPGSGVGGTVSGAPVNASVIYVVAVPGETDSLHGYGKIVCGGVVSELELLVDRDGRLHATANCVASAGA